MVGGSDSAKAPTSKDLKSLHGISNAEARTHSMAPSFSAFGKASGRPAEKSPTASSEDPATKCNPEVSRLMNEFYESPRKTKDKLVQILEEVKVACDENLANSIFASIYCKIKSYIKSKRRLMYNKLSQLGLLYSVKYKKSFGQGYPVINPRRTIRYRPGDVILNIEKTRAVSEAPEKYVDFFRALCTSYNTVCEVASAEIEAVCEELLVRCQIGNDVAGCNVHKSLFFDYVLKDRLVMVLWVK